MLGSTWKQTYSPPHYEGAAFRGICCKGRTIELGVFLLLAVKTSSERLPSLLRSSSSPSPPASSRLQRVSQSQNQVSIFRALVKVAHQTHERERRTGRGLNVVSECGTRVDMNVRPHSLTIMRFSIKRTDQQLTHLMSKLINGWTMMV